MERRRLADRGGRVQRAIRRSAPKRPTDAKEPGQEPPSIVRLVGPVLCRHCEQAGQIRRQRIAWRPLRALSHASRPGNPPGLLDDQASQDPLRSVAPVVPSTWRSASATGVSGRLFPVPSFRLACIASAGTTVMVILVAHLASPSIAPQRICCPEGGRRSDPSHSAHITAAKFSRKRLTGFSNP